MNDETSPVELQPGEHIILYRRRHWLHLEPLLAAMALAGVVPIVALGWIVGATTGLGGMGGLIVLAVSVVWALYWLVRGYFAWYRYRHDIWLVTNQRLVDSLKRHWFHHQVASADLIDVEDIAVVRHGLLQTMFNFGDVRCQTAGEQANFVLAGIPDPVGTLSTIDQARDSARREAGRPVN